MSGSDMNLEVMRAIARILRSDGRENPGKGGGRREAAWRLLTAWTAVLLMALSRNAWFTAAVFAVAIFLTAWKPAEDIRHILRPVGVAALFAAVFSLPAVFLGSPRTFGTILGKTVTSVLVLSLVNESLSWQEITGGLRVFHVPAVFIFTLEQMVRFLVILGRFSNRILEAVSLRRVGKRKWSNAGTGGILGITVLKSRQYAAGTTEAMRCRGFTGTYPVYPEERKRSRKEKILAVGRRIPIPALIAGFIYTQSLMH